MSPERIVALLVGGFAIVFGAMLLRPLTALFEKMIERSPDPPFRISVGPWSNYVQRFHHLAWMFLVVGVVLVAYGLFGE